jgi:hypothetical protein
MTLHCCWWFLYDFTFSKSSRIMVISKVWFNWGHLIIQNFETVEMLITRFLRWNLQLSFQGIIYNTLLFIFRDRSFRLLSYPGTTYFCKPLVRLLLIGPSVLDHRFLIPRSFGHDVYSDLIFLTCPIVLLTIIFISLRIILIALTYGHSKWTKLSKRYRFRKELPGSVISPQSSSFIPRSSLRPLGG